jgi:hypothetical protein
MPQEPTRISPLCCGSGEPMRTTSSRFVPERSDSAKLYCYWPMHVRLLPLTSTTLPSIENGEVI